MLAGVVFGQIRDVRYVPRSLAIAGAINWIMERTKGTYGPTFLRQRGRKLAGGVPCNQTYYLVVRRCRTVLPQPIRGTATQC